jgi:dihydrofolate synthase/folylpolyglutamate synthase
MTYAETLDWLYQALPMYQRIGAAAFKKDLTNIRQLCTLLGDPQDAFPTVHVAGTNGKGSTSHMLAAIFRAAGWKTGLYTSPHYVDFRERIRIDGAMIGRDAVIDFVEAHKAEWAEIRPSFFEMTVAMAFDHFRREQVDIAIIETGLGGRLDSTNIIMPRLSVITNIGFDHMQMLGHTLEAIAGEKAGIIKPGIPVVIGEWHAETAPVFRRTAAARGSGLSFACRHIRLRREAETSDHVAWSVHAGRRLWMDQLRTDMTGPYQRQNVRTALEAVYQWNRSYPEDMLPDEAVRRGLADVKGLSGMIGRWMRLREMPTVITDAAHNLHGMQAMLPRLLALPAKQRHFVLGFVSDKDIAPVLDAFPADGKYYWCAPDIPRRKPAEEVQAEAGRSGRTGMAYTSVGDAYNAAMAAAGPDDLIFVGGSSFVVGDFLAFLGHGQ